MVQTTIQEHANNFYPAWTSPTEDRFKILVEKLSIGIIVHDPITKIQFSNPAAAKMLGLSIEQMNGLQSTDPYWCFIREDESVIPIEEYPVNLVYSTKKPLVSQVIGVRRPDRDTPIWALVNGFPEFNDEGEISQVVINFTDITERKILEKSLIASKEVAEKALILKSRFLDIAAHELRTPITSFSLIVQLAIKQLAKGKPVEAPTLQRLKSQADRISHLVIDLLDVSRLERGSVSLKFEKKDLILLLTECLNDFKLRAHSRNVIFKKPEVEVLEINIDTIRIYQVFSNLLDNAIKYTEETSPIEIFIELKPKFVRVSVKDHGPGISLEQQEQLFRPFTRGSTELTERSGGLGLGLFICRSLIELHGGVTGVVSQLGAGSTFYFELPR